MRKGFLVSVIVLAAIVSAGALAGEKTGPIYNKVQQTVVCLASCDNHGGCDSLTIQVLGEYGQPVAAGSWPDVPENAGRFVPYIWLDNPVVCTCEATASCDYVGEGEPFERPAECRVSAAILDVGGRVVAMQGGASPYNSNDNIPQD